MTAVAMPTPTTLPRPLTSGFAAPLLMGVGLLLVLTFMVMGVFTLGFGDRIPDDAGFWESFGHALALAPRWLPALLGLGIALISYQYVKLVCRERTTYLMWMEMPQEIVHAYPHQQRHSMRNFVAVTDWLGESPTNQDIFARKLFLLERACALQDQLVTELMAKAKQQPFACLRPGDYRRIAVMNLLGEVVFLRSGGTYADLMNTVTDPAYPRAT